MKLKHILPTLIAILFAAGCARQSSPTGGPKDTIPPKLISATPKNEQTNFTGKTITVEFSELIGLNSPKEQIIITPSVGKDYEITSKKNSVTVQLNEPLDPNTTYTVNFREGVRDLTEKNPAQNLKLAFSTGEYIDSLSITGTVQDLLSATPKKDITVALQHAVDTLSIMKHPSFYFTRTNEKGEFKLDYIKPGSYQIYAYEDKNKNLVVDSRNEAYGFLAKPLSLTNDTAKVTIKTLKLDTRPLKITSARPYNTYFNIKASKNLSRYTATSPGQDISTYFGEDQANIRIYNTFTDADSTLINIHAEDSLGQKLDTAVYAKFRTEKNITKEKFSMTITRSRILARTGQIEIVYKFNKPVKEFNLDSIFYRKDSLTTINFNTKDVNYLPERNEFTITKTVDKKLFVIEEIDPSAPPAKQKDTTATQLKLINELYTGKSAFISIESDTSARQKTKLEPSQPNNLSEILYKLKTKNTNILVQVLDKTYTVVEQHEGSKNGSFKDLPAGDYIIRYVIDRNGNKQWDPGNYLTKTEPEPVYYATDAKGSITKNLKANWELELEEMLISE